MVDVRINGKRAWKVREAITLGALIGRVQDVTRSSSAEITKIFVNNEPLDFEEFRFSGMKFYESDTIDVRVETEKEMAIECLQVAQDMAELLVFDIKVATVHLWDDAILKNKSLETLIEDCHKFLSLAAQPLHLLGASPSDLSEVAQKCLRQLDFIANTIEDATLLSVSGSPKDACVLLVSKVMGAIETWIGLSAQFADELNLAEAGNEVFADPRDRKTPANAS